MKIVCISDTHGQHRSLQVPAGDVVVHAGDLSKRGELAEVQDFLAWFSGLPHRYKIFVAGNHDFAFERNPAQTEALVPDNCHYLNDSGVALEGIHFWGSPITPFFFDWAFNRHRGEPIRRHWDLIPAEVDVLITHGPPFGVLDRTVRGDAVGCEELRQKMNQSPPRLHIFGHIHEGYGYVAGDKTQYVNASVVDVRYRLVNQPVVVTL